MASAASGAPNDPRIHRATRRSRSPSWSLRARLLFSRTTVAEGNSDQRSRHVARCIWTGGMGHLGDAWPDPESRFGTPSGQEPRKRLSRRRVSATATNKALTMALSGTYFLVTAFEANGRGRRWWSEAVEIRFRTGRIRLHDSSLPDHSKMLRDVGAAEDVRFTRTSGEHEKPSEERARHPTAKQPSNSDIADN